MKQVLKAAVLLGALLGAGLSVPGHAATDVKKPQAVAKKDGSKDVAAAKLGSRKAVASKSNTMTSPRRATSARRSVFTGDLAWHSAERKTEKSRSPSSRRSTCCR